MKVLFCDDDFEMLKKIETDFFDYFYRKLDNLDITIKLNNFTELSSYDLCFLDIDLIDYDGIRLAERLKEINNQIIIIFISQREDLVFKSLTVHPFQFIRKNHYKEDLQQTFNQLNTFLNKKTITLTLLDKEKVNIKVSDIVSAISIDHDVIVSTTSKTYTIKDSLKHFCECNNTNYIVQVKKNLGINMIYIEKVDGIKVLYNNEIIKIGRSYQKNFKKLYERYLVECL